MGDHRAPEESAGSEASPAPVVDTPVEAAVLEADQTPVPADEAPSDGPRPEPVMDAAKLAGAISAAILALGGLLKFLGILVPPDYDLDSLASQAGNAVLVLGGGWSLIGPAVVARFRARDKVTPLSDPRAADGTPLTPEGT